MEFTYCKLIDVLSDIHSGGTPSTEESSYWGGNIKWLSSGETSQRFISDTVDKITEEGVKNSSTKLAKKNNIIMACAGQGKTRGQTSYLLDDIYINQSVIALESNASVLPLYLFYNLSSRYEELRGGSDASSTRGSITTTALKNLPFKYPDLSIQQSIVDILFGYDSLIETNNRRIELLEQTAQELYKEWFVRFRFPGYKNAKFEDGFPKGWTIKRLADYGRVETGKTPSTEIIENYGGEMMFVKTPDMHSNMFIIQTEDKLSERGHNTQPKKLLPANSIMVSCIGTAGVVSINARPAHTNQQINSIILNNPNELEWLYHTCKSLKETIELFGATGATMTNLSKGKFEKLKVVDPGEDLILTYHNKVKPLFDEIKSLMYQNQNLAAQRDMLLPRLMSGKLEV